MESVPTILKITECSCASELKAVKQHRVVIVEPSWKFAQHNKEDRSRPTSQWSGRLRAAHSSAVHRRVRAQS